MTDFQYSTLNPTKREIRVLELHPGVQGEMIICDLTTISLSDDIYFFEAVSYTWGDPSDLRPITLEGSDWHVTKNLEIALQHLRYRLAVRRLWVDALCINQENNQERLHQVNLMRFVYQNAGRVLVWLGPSFENSDRAGAFLKVKGEEIVAGGRKGGSTPFGSFPPDAVKAVCSLMRRPYWYRVWIVQEVSLPSDDPLIGCGCWWLPWSTFCSGMFHINHYFKVQDLKIRQGEPSDAIDAIGVDEWWALSFSFLGLDSARKDAQEGGAVPNPWRDGRSLLESPRKRDFRDLLWTGSVLRATDSRDHVYGLLGLANCKTQVDIGISPDYTKPTSLVWLEAFKAAVEIEDNLEVLNLRNHLPCSPLPSWVLDFTRPTSLCYPTLAPDAIYHWSAFGGRSLRYQLSSNLEVLTVQGVPVDIIERVMDLDEFDEEPSIIYNVHKMATSTIGEDLELPPGRQSLAIEAIWRTLVGNKSAEGDFPCPGDYQVMYEYLVRQGSPIPTLSKRDAAQEEVITLPFIHAMAEAVRLDKSRPHRRFFRTCRGLFGLGTPDCCTGDTVAIFYGYSRPVILRPLENEYTFIGSAYVHGIMMGEALDKYGREEIPSVDFVLR
jgi:hypothetical protein